LKCRALQYGAGRVNFQWQMLLQNHCTWRSPFSNTRQRQRQRHPWSSRLGGTAPRSVGKLGKFGTQRMSALHQKQTCLHSGLWERGNSGTTCLGMGDIGRWGDGPLPTSSADWSVRTVGRTGGV
jgi:hypothetical protein